MKMTIELKAIRNGDRLNVCLDEHKVSLQVGYSNTIALTTNDVADLQEALQFVERHRGIAPERLVQPPCPPLLVPEPLPKLAPESPDPDDPPF